MWRRIPDHLLLEASSQVDLQSLLAEETSVVIGIDDIEKPFN
jgi:hypothetical protein